MSEEQQSIGTTGPADEQVIPSDHPEDAAPGDVIEPGAKILNGEVEQPMPYPHDVQPGYGVTGKFPTDHDDDGDGHALEVSDPASETDALAVEAPAPVTAEQPAAEADQLDVPADQRGDTA
jgi:hypothetical protein